MDLKAQFNKFKLPNIFKKLNLEKIPHFSKIIDSAIIVENHKSKLILWEVSSLDKVKVKNYRAINLIPEKKNEIATEALASFIKDVDIHATNTYLIPKLESLFIKRLQLPAMPEEEMKDALKWEIKEDCPFDLSEAIIDYEIIDKEVKSDAANTFDVICVLAKEEELREQILLLRQLGLKCVAAIPRAFIYPKFIYEYSKEKNNTPVSVLHIGEDSSYIVVCYNRKLEFYRELPLSISKLKEYLSGRLALEAGEISLTEEEAEELLFNIGIPQEDANYKGKISSNQILGMLRPGLERLIQEIKRSLNYYHTELRPKFSKINRIFLGGKAKKIPNLGIFLSEELSLEVKVITAEEEIKILPQINRKDCLGNIESLGIILDYKRGINILPYEFRTEDIEKVQKISLRWIAFIISLFLIVSYFFTKVAIKAYRWRLDNALLHLNVISEVKKMKTDRDQIGSFISELKAKEPSAGQLLKVLSSISDREVFFNKFTLDSKSKIGFIDGFIKSTKNNPDAILANFADRMSKSEYFSKVEISSVKKRKEPPFEITDFHLNFEVPLK